MKGEGEACVRFSSILFSHPSALAGAPRVRSACCLTRAKSVNKGAFVALCWLIVYFLRQFSYSLQRVQFIYGKWFLWQAFSSLNGFSIIRSQRCCGGKEICGNFKLTFTTENNNADRFVSCVSEARVKCANEHSLRHSTTPPRHSREAIKTNRNSCL